MIKPIRQLIKGFGMVSVVIRDWCSRKKAVPGETLSKPYVILKSGTFKNKGDQAMIFTAVIRLKKRFPEKKVVVSVGQRSLPPDSQDFNFKIVLWDNDFKYYFITGRKRGIRRSFFSIQNSSSLKENQEILENTSAIYDISGYSLSSQIGFGNSINYLMTIIMARKLRIPYYILTQSIGPLDFRFPQRVIIHLLLKLYLRYPQKVYVRERKSLEWLKPYRIEHIFTKPDIVFSLKDYDASHLYRKTVKIKKFAIGSASVGIIPNDNILKRLPSGMFYSLYRDIIQWLLDEGVAKVYIVKHCEHDYDLCQNIYDHSTASRNRLEIITEDLSCVELGYLFAHFKFIVASRYHAIVQSFKMGTPAVVIGWAQKYKELMGLFSQSGYLFDCRDTISIDHVRSMIVNMNRCYRTEHQKLVSILPTIMKNSIIDELASVERTDVTAI
jgi:polysaccharide pyruvyl transferase WcaK-like protein